MSKFKVGDMAIVIGANYIAENIGKVVELSAFVSDGDLYAGPNGSLYRHSDIPCWVVRGDDVQFRTDEGTFFGFGLHEERHLMRIEPDSIPVGEILVAIDL